MMMTPLENLWVQIPKFQFNYLISHNKTSKYSTASNNGCIVTSQKVRVKDEKVLDISNYACYVHNA